MVGEEVKEASAREIADSQEAKTKVKDALRFSRGLTVFVLPRLCPLFATVDRQNPWRSVGQEQKSVCTQRCSHPASAVSPLFLRL